ncbi:dimethylmenaquinone methyltransferase [Salipiger aestuarii]|uniref:DnaJ like chaperone protein n=1 Tax=Salipiger aestuarii TaxID=568098 RepID=A0A327Y0N8_9RHOB|nr:TerB family tellurite resistance protein [Salipiger aestuarii]EIE48682.1 heat shock protein DnaJ domain protein [Citreicella sp. 357]KAA8606676.1 dimethylmenaquinone methyltransferase [Salipiger aestuarii]KAA8610541.1 dimethylmenaquinone methyltransferase [Salipiger aestuarii]KAB2541290.1 dimethylmenaquinone methyltransferase [Salipiger aestuarii]RAK13941.1 DnaJ like chaperone protein [Salipiger aestuarii]
MSIWTRISEALSALASGESLGAVFDRLRNPPERSVAFTIAVIALSAKMAKADGRVTRNEVSAFREVFSIAPEDEAAAARVFNLARQDVAGYEDYAIRIRRMFGDRDGPLLDLLEGLFYIAIADGQYHPTEDAFLERVAAIFDIPQSDFRTLRMRFVPDAVPDPYAVLGVSPDAPLPEVRKHWRQLVRDCHPDVMQARGVPEEAVKMSEKRLIAINHAWEEISARHAA